ncbi:hypothetical protein SUGI_0898000 [Cryptomeria japonica]|uniref:uncharacterized protein LOC131077919 n=1 Tax=Cryptomeria japonica TaxID=3369 RepID=UPI002414B8D0|nr:uncharacterized protein LOC131077919 [Cryptomeria japonica]GLJ43252.1 hypothetical protein SUGI_0898000 [Cryptomeria japonica]
MVSIEGARLLKPIEEEEAAFSSEFGCFGCCFGYRSVNNGHENWWRQGLSKSMKKAREWSGSVVHKAGNSGQKLRNLVRRLKNRSNNGDNGTDMKAGVFRYDPSSYALNFDDGSREDHQAFVRACH